VEQEDGFPPQKEQEEGFVRQNSNCKLEIKKLASLRTLKEICIDHFTCLPTGRQFRITLAF
jgi:hypothetical protein